MNELDSYIYGLLITDGYLVTQIRNRGHVSLELNINDRDIIDKLCEIIPNSTKKECIRNTHFKKNCHTIIFRNSRLWFRSKLILQGFPTNNKTFNANPPIVPYNEFHFWRGAIDGDGCLGISAKRPYITFSTSSEILKDAYLSFIKTLFNIDKNINKGKDNVYNIRLRGENAIKLIKLLYIDNKGLSIERKMNIATNINNTFIK